MQTTRINWWSILIAAAILGGGLLRFLNLGSAPLSDTEARWALGAYEVANANGIKSLVRIEPQPAYIFLTALLLDFFGDTNFTARFWPALAGVAMMLAPLLLQKWVGRRAVLIALIGLAVDPGLVVASRQAGGPTIAAAGLILAIVFWLNMRPILSGILAGIALLSGPAIFPGLMSAGLIWLFLRQKSTRDKQELTSSEADLEADWTSPDSDQPFQNKDKTSLKSFFIAMLAALLILGTLFLQFPQGLAASAQSLVVYLTGWAAPSTVSPVLALIALVVFHSFPLVFAILAGFRCLNRRNALLAREKRSFWILAVGIASSFALVVLYPGRQVSDLVWVLSPLWIMASLELRTAFPNGNANIVSIGHAGLILILASLLWITMVGSGNLASDGSIAPETIRFGLLFGILSLGVFTTVLIALGWSTEISRFGTIWGVALVAAIYSISAAWGASQLRPNQPAEIWHSIPGTGQQNLMIKTLADLSNRNTGRPNTIQITSIVDWPSLRWGLRGFENVTYAGTLLPRDRPAVIITTADLDEPTFSAFYRGQDFIWKTNQGWDGPLPTDLFNWLTFRTAPITPEKIIVWVREDQFPGGSFGGVESEFSNP